MPSGSRSFQKPPPKRPAAMCREAPPARAVCARLQPAHRPKRSVLPVFMTNPSPRHRRRGASGNSNPPQQRSAENELRVCAARSRRRSSVGRTRGLGRGWGYGDFTQDARCPGRGSPVGRRGLGSAASVSRSGTPRSSRLPASSGQGSGQWLGWRQRVPVAYRGTRQQDRAAAEAGGADHGPMA